MTMFIFEVDDGFDSYIKLIVLDSSCPWNFGYCFKDKDIFADSVNFTIKDFVRMKMEVVPKIALLGYPDAENTFLCIKTEWVRGLVHVTIAETMELVKVCKPTISWQSHGYKGLCLA